MKEQMVVTLNRRDGQYLNFFNTPGSIDSLSRLIGCGWLLKETFINDSVSEKATMLFEREIIEPTGGEG